MLLLNALVDHLFVAILEDMQRNDLARESNHAKWEEREVLFGSVGHRDRSLRRGGNDYLYRGLSVPPTTMFAMAEQTVEEYERQFRKAGLPLFIEDYSAREDVFTRAVPFLTFFFLLEMLNAVQLRWSAWQNLLAGFGGLIFLLLAFGLINRILGRKFFSRPDSVGRVELGAFVILPALLPLIFNQHLGEAALIVLQNIILLGLVYSVVGLGLISIIRWAATRVFSQLAASLSLAARAIPLLLFFSVVLFMTNEVWQVMSLTPRVFLLLLLGLIVLVDIAFITTRLPNEVRRLEDESIAKGSLSRAQRLNVGLVVLVSQSLQVLIVTAATAIFYGTFGLLAVGSRVMEIWIGSTGHELFSFDLFGEPIVVTEELILVTAAVAVLSGLYYSISIATDGTYRKEFLRELEEEMHETFQARQRYLQLKDAS